MFFLDYFQISTWFEKVCCGVGVLQEWLRSVSGVLGGVLWAMFGSVLRNCVSALTNKFLRDLYAVSVAVATKLARSLTHEGFLLSHHLLHAHL